MQFVASTNRRCRILYSEGEELSCTAYHRRPDRTSTKRMRTIDETHRTTNLYTTVAHLERVHAFGERVSADGSMHGRIGQSVDSALRVFGQRNEAFHRSTQNGDRFAESFQIRSGGEKNRQSAANPHLPFDIVHRGQHLRRRRQQGRTEKVKIEESESRQSEGHARHQIHSETDSAHREFQQIRELSEQENETRFVEAAARGHRSRFPYQNGSVAAGDRQNVPR